MSWASPFRFENRPGSRPYTGDSGYNSLGGRSVPPTPKFDYDYARSPTPIYQRQHRIDEVVLDEGIANGGSEKKGRPAKGHKKNKKRRGPDPTEFDDPGEFQTTCMQGTDPDHPNHVIWGARQKWLETSGPSPGPITAVPTQQAAKVLSNVPGVPSVVIGGAKPKNDVDWKIYRASFIPSPADYMIKDEWTGKNGGGRFSTAFPKEHLDWVKYYASQIPAPGDYKIKGKTIKGGRIPKSCPKNDVEWKIYRASFIPGPGKYDNMSSTSMAHTGAVERKGAVFQGKVVKGNSRTIVPSNFTMFKHTTAGPSSLSCRTDSSVGRQVSSYQKTAPAFSFGSRTPAASIFGLPPPAKPKKRKYRKKKKKKSEMIGYNPFNRPKVQQTELMLKATESISSLSSSRSDGELHNATRRLKGGRTSKTYIQQYRKCHKLSRPKYVAKLPHLDYEHYAKMGRIASN